MLMNQACIRVREGMTWKGRSSKSEKPKRNLIPSIYARLLSLWLSLANTHRDPAPILSCQPRHSNRVANNAVFPTEPAYTKCHISHYFQSPFLLCNVVIVKLWIYPSCLSVLVGQFCIKHLWTNFQLLGGINTFQIANVITFSFQIYTVLNWYKTRFKSLS